MTPGPALQKFLDALTDSGRITKDCGSYYLAQCPAHDDTNPSLSITTNRSGTGFVVNCFAGCDYREVLAAMTMTESDLYDDKAIRDSLGPTQTYIYAGGRKNYRVLRNGRKSFWQENSKDDSLYGVERLTADEVVYFCEGEKAVEFLRPLGYQAVATGGAQRTCDLTPLTGRDVTVIADRDAAGYTWALRNMQALIPIAKSVRVVQSKYPGAKADVVEHISAGYSMEELEPFAAPGDPGVQIANADRADAGAAPAQKVEPPDDTGPVATGVLEALEEDFWTARPELELIYTAALSQMGSPWAVFACCIARVLSQIPPSITLPAIIGGRGSLNWFATLAAKSGGGKGVAMSIASRLVPGDVNIHSIGSGEGMLDCYDRGPRKPDDDRPEVISVLFSIDEVDSLTAQKSRTGQTTMPILRQGFSGESLGFSYRGRQKERVMAHTYRMTLLMSVQPSNAGVLLEDSGGGTPQRFMWFPARDLRVVADVPEWPMDQLGARLNLPLPAAWEVANAPRVVPVPDEVITEIREARAASMRGDDNALDGHALFCREKLAYALAYINGRFEISLEDWRLSAIASQVSDWTRDKVAMWYQVARDTEARERGRIKGVEGMASEVGRASEYERVQKVKKRILEVVAASPDGMTRREISQRFNGRGGLRDLVDDALVYLEAAGMIFRVETDRWKAT